MNSGSKRIFLGIPVSGEIKEKVKEIQEELPKDGLKLVNPENLHLTLKFIGWVREDKLEKIKEILRDLNFEKRFKVKVRKIGAFPSENSIRVIWFGLEDSKKIFSLHKLIDSSLSKLSPEEKRFSAHITLARAKLIDDKEKLKKFLEKFKDIELGEMTIDKVILYQSVLRREGPEYKVLEEYSLG